MYRNFTNSLQKPIHVHKLPIHEINVSTKSLIKQEMNKTGNISNALKAKISGKSSISTKNS